MPLTSDGFVDRDHRPHIFGMDDISGLLELPEAVGNLINALADLSNIEDIFKGGIFNIGRRHGGIITNIPQLPNPPIIGPATPRGRAT